MSTHESVTDEFVSELRAAFLVEAEKVKSAIDWPSTQKAMTFGTYPYLVAMDRTQQGWTREEIESELKTRIGFGTLPGPFRTFGGPPETQKGGGA